MRLPHLLAVALALGVAPGAATDAPRPPPVGLLGHGLAATLLAPATPEPRGIVIALYDPLGPTPRAGIYEQQLVAAGFAVLVILGSDGEEDALERAIQALTSGAHGPTTPVGVLAFGAGAAPALRPVPGIAARALLYPGCAELPPAPDAAPLLLMHGSEDAANPLAACSAAARAFAAGPREVRHIVYRGAGYAWDRTNPGYERTAFLLPRPDRQGYVTARPWPELGSLSASEVAGFFSTAISRPPASASPDR
ncbi:MAG: hypothetical protein K2X11_14655 [Acetobacteraceae bacterium]|nr:hypothetical protein [Acetobacteraceae bacterium]